MKILEFIVCLIMSLLLFILPLAHLFLIGG
jgi:hypothetical protein